MLFKNVVGNSEIKEVLIKEVSRSVVAHAQLFESKDDANTIPMALAYATYLLCLNRLPLDSCGKCHHCVKMNKLAHPDLHFFYPSVQNLKLKKTSSLDYFSDFKEMLLENPSRQLSCWTKKMGFGKLSKDSIRVKDSEEVKRVVLKKPYEGAYSIFIFWHPELMSNKASNSLLKLIEEPNDKILFLFITNNSNLLLPTIKSRLQSKLFAKIQTEELLVHFSKLFPKVEKSIIKSKIYENSNHYINTLKELSDNSPASKKIDNFIDWVRLCFNIINKRKASELIKWCNDMASKERSEQEHFLELSSRVFRKSFLTKYKINYTLYPHIEDHEFLKKFIKYVNTNNICEIFELIDKSNFYIKNNANPKLIFLDLSLSIGKILQSKNS